MNTSIIAGLMAVSLASPLSMPLCASVDMNPVSHHAFAKAEMFAVLGELSTDEPNWTGWRGVIGSPDLEYRSADAPDNYGSAQIEFRGPANRRFNVKITTHGYGRESSKKTSTRSISIDSRGKDAYVPYSACVDEVVLAY